MGRKNRNKKSAQGASSSLSETPKPLSKTAKKEMMDHVKALLDKCSQPATSSSKEFEDYLEMRELVDKIRSIQKDISLKSCQREGNFDTFQEWLKSNKVDISATEIAKFPGCGYGLKAARDLKETEQFLAIPRELMMTVATAKVSVLGSLMAEDRILQVMPSVVLALHLLCERRSPDSRWKPYIDILPESYSTPLYFSEEELKQLKGSPAFTDCINQYRSIARQYAYFCRLFQNDTSSATTNLPLKEFFTYDDYRWAVSTVMTRQNQIPTTDGSKMTFALIPLWDMCNHCNGLITTDFSIEKDCSECFSLRSFQKGDQIFIFYGARSNGELLVNNGFVYPDNEHDRMAIKLGISKSDPLFNLKSEVLTRCGLLVSRTFYLHTGSFPVDTDLLMFLRIFSMDEDNLNKFKDMDATELREEMGDMDKVIAADVEVKMWGYLETRVSLLLKAYETSVEDDENILKKGKLSEHSLLAVQLRCCEKKILEATAAYSCDRILKDQLNSENS